MSPVEMWGMAKSSRRRSAWVPLPAPGGPRRIRFNSDTTRGSLSAHAHRVPAVAVFVQSHAPELTGTELLLQETLVAAHHQLRLELLHGFQRNPDHDQDGGPTEGELLMGARDQDRGESRHGGEEERPREGEAGEDAIEEFS